MKQASQFVIVLGPHRSGSSLVAGALHSLGVKLGNRYIQPNEDNPKGFFEDEDIVRLNDRLLRSMHLSWDSFGFIWEQDFSSPRLKPYHDAAVAMVKERFSQSKNAGLKDPRFCILLPFWKNVIAEALDVQVSYVLSIRVPEQCVASQKARHQNDSDFHLLGRRSIQTLLLWWTYMTKALAYIDPRCLLIADYTAMVTTPELQLQRIARFLNVEASQLQIEKFCQDHVEPLLNRSQQGIGAVRAQSPLLWRQADMLYQRLVTLSRKDAIEPEELDAILARTDIQELESLYLQEMQFMYGYAYRKIISLRHRLIQTIDEMGNEREKLQDLLRRHDSLQVQYDVLNDQYSVLADQFTRLTSEHDSVSSDLQTVLNTRGWRMLVFVRRYLPWPFR